MFAKSERSHSSWQNYYQNLWTDSEHVASEVNTTACKRLFLAGLRFHTGDAVVLQLATEARLASVVTDINSHHQAVAHVDNPSPVWMKDMLLNQFSHFHMLYVQQALSSCCS